MSNHDESQTSIELTNKENEQAIMNRVKPARTLYLNEFEYTERRDSHELRKTSIFRFREEEILLQRYINQIQTFKKRLSVRYNQINKLPVVNPNNTLLLLWKFMIALFTVMYFFIAPAYCAFGDQLWSGFFSNVSLDALESIIFFFFFFDILLQFNTGYYIHGNNNMQIIGSLVTTKNKIASHYLENFFLFDIIALIVQGVFVFDYNSFILQIIQVNADSDLRHRYAVQTSGKNLLIYHLLFYFRCFSLFQIDRLILNYIDNHRTIQTIYKLVKVVLIITFITQILACLFYMCGIWGIRNHQNSWLIVQNNSFGTIANLSLQEQYFYALYFAFGNVTGMSFGDILPINRYEVVLSMCGMVTGILLFGFIIDRIHQILQDHRQPQVKFQNNLQTISRFMDSKEISDETQQKVKQYLAEYHEAESNRDQDQEKVVIGSLGFTLRDQLIYESFKGMFENIPFFANLSKECKIKLAQKVQEISCAQDEVLFLDRSDAQKNDNIYFIQDGCVRLFINSPQAIQDQEIFIAKMKEGQYFGEYTFLTGQPRKASAQCRRFSHLYVLSRQDFIEVIQQFSDDCEKICQIRDQILNNHEYTGKCFTCDSRGHYIDTCPLLHYQPDVREVLISIEDNQNQRKKKHKRKKKKQKRVVQDFENSQVQGQIQRISMNAQNEGMQTPNENKKRGFSLSLQIPKFDHQQEDNTINNQDIDKHQNFNYYYPFENPMIVIDALNNR